MTLLEKAVKDLADALDDLELAIDDRLDSRTLDSQSLDAMRKTAGDAKLHTQNAAAGLADAISELKTILNQKTGQ